MCMWFDSCGSSSASSSSTSSCLSLPVLLTGIYKNLLSARPLTSVSHHGYAGVNLVSTGFPGLTSEWVI